MLLHAAASSDSETIPPEVIRGHSGTLAQASAAPFDPAQLPIEVTRFVSTSCGQSVWSEEREN
jgi:hypothetical protein